MKYPIIILHGWKLFGKRYEAIEKIFKKNGYRVFAPDMPGFGSEKLKKPTMDLQDYADFVYEFIKRKKIKKTYLIGHSFGGRVATKFTYLHPEYVERLVLTGAPLLRKKTLRIRLLGLLGSASKMVFSFLPKSINNFLRHVLYKFIGEFDYYKAGDLSETFKKIINEDLSPLLSKINVPTLLLWGENERVVSIEIGREIHKRLSNAQFISITQATHMLPYEKPEAFANRVLQFLSENK